MSFKEDDLKIAVAMFEVFDLPKIPIQKDINDFGEEVTTYILGEFLGVRTVKKIYACGLKYDLTLVLITEKTYIEPARVLGRYYEKFFLIEQEVIEELFHLNNYIMRIDSVEKPFKEYLDILKKLLKRIDKEPIEFAPIIEKKIKEIERAKKISERCDELMAKNLEKNRRYYEGLTTPAPKEETKVRFHRMKEKQKPRFITTSSTLNKKLLRGDKELEKILEATFEIMKEENEKSK